MEFSKTLTFFVMLALVLSACQSAPQPLHYGGQLYAEELLLQGMDAWSSYSLNIEHVLFKSPDDLTQAFRSGVVDIALFSDIQAAEVFAEMGNKALIIAVSERGNRISTIVRADSGIQSWADLSGKKVALRVGSGAELALRRFFNQTKPLAWDEVEWVNLPVEEMPAMLSSGSVQAITATEPIPAMAQALGGMKVLQSYDDCCQSPLVVVTTSSFAENHRTELVAFLQGHLDKLALIQSDSALAARTASEQAKTYDLEIAPAAFQIVFKRVDFSLEVDEQVISALEDTARSMLQAGALEEIPEFYFDTSYLDAALEKKPQ
jgi:ABC-type nitrate/sulfonate/bicarbonate transport system substrate-binding protein